MSCASDEVGGLDAGDVGGGRDAALESDGGLPRDSGGRSDSGVSFDSGSSVDSGGVFDGGGALDSGSSADGGGSSDGEVQEDSGAVADGGQGADSGAGLGCSIDQDCAPDGWCRETELQDKVCVPWAVAGEYCAGFSPPWAVSRCDPSLTCFPAFTIPDAPGVCVEAQVTVDELLADPPGYADLVVGILTAYALAKSPTCAGGPCPSFDPCCEVCTADELLADRSGDTDGLALESPAGQPYSCGGSRCDYADHCELALPGPYRVVGTFRDAPPVLELSTSSLLP